MSTEEKLELELECKGLAEEIVELLVLNPKLELELELELELVLQLVKVSDGKAAISVITAADGPSSAELPTT